MTVHEWISDIVAISGFLILLLSQWLRKNDTARKIESTVQAAQEVHAKQLELLSESVSAHHKYVAELNQKFWDTQWPKVAEILVEVRNLSQRVTSLEQWRASRSD